MIRKALPLFLALVCFSAGAKAQNDERVSFLIERAQNAYFDLELDQALRYIDDGLEMCAERCTAADIGKLQAFRGVIVAAQEPDNPEGAKAVFKEALIVDPDAALDPMVVTPDNQALFDEAKAELAAAGDDVAEGSRMHGQTCGLDEHCQPGLACVSGRCEDRRARSLDETDRGERGFLEVGYSFGVATAHANMHATSGPEGIAHGVDPQLDTDPANDGYILSGTGDCNAPPGEYCVRVTEGLGLFSHGLHLGGGYFVTERVAIGARLRFTPGSGSGPLSNFLLGVRTHIRLTEPVETGFQALFLAGLMVGQIQVQPFQDSAVEGVDVVRPWAKTGLGGLEAGVKLGYRFHRNVGVYISPEAYVLFPRVSLGLLATAGVDVAFGHRVKTITHGTQVLRVRPGDRDGDGIPDVDDQCPDEPEDFDGFEDEDGCPDPDNDGDGIPDEQDQCPNEPEDMDGFEDEDGCPDLDNDGDGVPDTEDECPNEAGPALNKGCPFPDRDGDGVVDRFDNCPDEPGPPEFMGCPQRQLVELGESQIKIHDSIYFRRNGHVIERRSFELLDQLANVINSHPEITHIQIEGHTDSTGRRAYNVNLSKKRAEAVMRDLIRRGKVDRKRLSAHGFGPDRPIVPDARTDEEHAANRRVEFNITVENED